MDIPDSQPSRSRRGFGLAVLDCLSSIWTGIALLIAIIVYSALGSAIPPLRQYFELSELGWFNHVIFGTLLALFCVVLIIATFRRIRFNLVNAGVLTVHTGLLLLAGGSAIYFGRKVEGDVWLQPPGILIISKARLKSGEMNSAVLARVVAAEGKTWEQNMPAIGGKYR